MTAYATTEVKVELAGSNITVDRIKRSIFHEWDDYPKTLSLGQASMAVTRLEEGLDPDHPRELHPSVVEAPDYKETSAAEEYLEDLKEAVADAERIEDTQKRRNGVSEKKAPDGVWYIHYENDVPYRGPIYTEERLERIVDGLDMSNFRLEEVTEE